MKKLWSLGLVLALLLTGCGVGEKTEGEEASPTPQVTESVPPAPTPDPVRELLDSMTLEEKVGQLLIAGVAGTQPGEDGAQLIRQDRVGGIILFGHNVESEAQLAELTNGLKELNSGYIPLLLCVDQEGGRVERMPDTIRRLPDAYAVGKAEDPALWAAYGDLLAEECGSFGFNVDFAPVLDIWSNPDNKVIGRRAFGTDADVVTRAGLTVLEAM